jgi:hypothetical protein
LWNQAASAFDDAFYGRSVVQGYAGLYGATPLEWIGVTAAITLCTKKMLFAAWHQP